MSQKISNMWLATIVAECFIVIFILNILFDGRKILDNLFFVALAIIVIGIYLLFSVGKMIYRMGQPNSNVSFYIIQRDNGDEIRINLFHLHIFVLGALLMILDISGYYIPIIKMLLVH